MYPWKPHYLRAAAVYIRILTPFFINSIEIRQNSLTTTRYIKMGVARTSHDYTHTVTSVVDLDSPATSTVARNLRCSLCSSVSTNNILLK